MSYKFFVVIAVIIISSSAQAADRVPISLSYQMAVGNWTMVPSVEYDITNYQHDGMRGELMFGQKADSYGWEFGPFVHYWNVEESDIDQYGGSGFQPKNIRLQFGLGLKFNY